MQSRESTNTKHSTLTTEEASHPLVYLCHMVPTLNTAQSDVANTTQQNKQRT